MTNKKIKKRCQENSVERLSSPNQARMWIKSTYLTYHCLSMPELLSCNREHREDLLMLIRVCLVNQIDVTQ